MYLALCGGPHIFTLRFTCAVLLWNSLGPTQISVTGVSPSLPLLSRSFSYLCWSHDGVRTPEKYLWFGLYRFRSPLLAVSISLSFPPLTEMFHFSGYRELCPTFPCGLQTKTIVYYHNQVIPFGNLRIKVYLPLPEAYRSLSRPSSPFSTKASTVCPLKLDFFRILLFPVPLFQVAWKESVFLADH